MAAKDLKTKELSRVTLAEKTYTNASGYYTHSLKIRAVLKQTTDNSETPPKVFDPKPVLRVELRPLDMDGEVRHGVRNYKDKKTGEDKQFSVALGDEVDFPIEYAKDLSSALNDFCKKLAEEPSKLFPKPEAS